MIITLQTLVFFRESLLNALDRLLRPYYNKLSLVFSRNGEASDDEESDEQVFAEYDEERGVVFYPPMYLQRYAAVSDCLMDKQWCGKLEKVVDLGYHDMSFINYLKEVQGVKCILGVDLDNIPLRCSIDLVGCEDYVPKRENPLDVTLFKGNAADPDYRLIGCDAVVAIEMIEHMLPHDLDRLIHTVFGFIKPWVAIFTTPNGDFNVLFKALEKNGLRRLDHFFEWSREQFHDWCSNIVARYPQYTVSCKGIGPGPSGTKHLGCCSQMALFVSKEYNKQRDLNLNSLALVPDIPSPHSVSNLISTWETPDIPNESNMIEPPKNTESYSELQSAMQSSITLVLSSATSSLETIHLQDKTTQCNLASETEKGYLMFDYEQMCFDVLNPRRIMNNHRVYEFEDVCNRLNCTTLEVNKFSKMTLNLMARNKLDTLVHTREVVDEIRHLTKMLNFNKEPCNQLENGTHTWCNINWGENAPYWNQYYKIVKAYNYPFEVKSDECRIIDLISDEINRLIDSQFDEDFSFEVNKLEIPIELLMRVVQHITDDVDKVKDLLEWNGYEVRGNYVIHSRMIVDYSSTGTEGEDSPINTEVYSDWDSTSLSDGSTTVPDYHARCLRKALDQKVRRLRSMLSADEDITTELDRVVCRLMKLALRTSKGRNTPPPTKWMQCKLLDLLTLTEKTIERRKRHFIESYQLKAINYEEKSQEMITLEKIKEDNTALKIVDKYKHLVNETDNMDAKYRHLDFELQDCLSITSTEFAKDDEFIDQHPINVSLEPEPLSPGLEMFESQDIAPQGETKLQRTQAWVEEDIEVVPYPIHDGIFDNSSFDTNHNAIKLTKYYKKRVKSKQCIELNCVIRNMKSNSKMNKNHKAQNKSRNSSRTKLVKKVSRKKSTNKVLGVQTTHSKLVSVDFRTHGVKSRKNQNKYLYTTSEKPIPVSLIELCHPEMMIRRDIGTFLPITSDMTQFTQEKVNDIESKVAVTKESKLIEIITEYDHETIALRRTIGTGADADLIIFDDETLIRSVSNTLINEDDVCEKQDMDTENVHSQTIFLYDIDEPTTSKGIRHIAMDVQCGPDSASPMYSVLSATTSLTKAPKIFMSGIKIGDSETDTKITNTDLGAWSSVAGNSYKTIIPRNKSVGIKINDSYCNIMVNPLEVSTVSTYSTQTAATSLTRIPDITLAEVKLGNSNTDAKSKNIDFEACANIPEYLFDNFPTESIEVKDSISIIPKQLGFPTNTTEPVNKTDVFQVTTIFESSPLSPVNKECRDNNSAHFEHSKDNPEQNGHLIVSSEQLLKNQSEVVEEPRVELELQSISTNVTNKIECPIKSQESYNESNSSSITPMCKKQKNSKSIHKKSVDFQLEQDKMSYTPKRFNCSTKSRILNPRKKWLNSSQQPTSKAMSLEESVLQRSDAVCESDSDLLSELQCSVETESYCSTRASTPSTLSFSNQSRLTISKLKLRSIDKKDDHDSNPDRTDHSQKTLEKNDMQKIKKNTAVMEYHEELKSDDLDFNDNFESPCITLEDVDLQIDSGSAKKLKQQLCAGGVQVYSYKDNQDLSEEILYQGQWQQNKAKVRARRKCLVTVSRKKDLNLKMKVNSKERMNYSRLSSSEKTSNNGKIKNDVKRRPLLPRNTIMKSLKQESEVKDTKREKKLPNRVCVATIAQPFRNILKVPSKFPISTLPSKNSKSFIVKKNYIPLYLKRLNTAIKISETDLNLSLDSVTSTSKENSKQLLRPQTEHIKRNVLKFRNTPLKPEYVVFRNEIEKKKSDGQQIKSTPDTPRKRDVSRQRSSTPTSGNSSTCSSPCSIATVRAVSARTKNITYHRHASSSCINNTTNSGSENSTLERNKKITKRCKITVENKENIPETSKHLNVKKDSVKHAKAVLLGKKKNVYISKVKDSLQPIANTPSKHKNQKLNLNTSTTKTYTDKKESPQRSPSLSNKISSNMLDAALSTTHTINISECAQTSNVVLIIEPTSRQLQSNPNIPKEYSKLDDINTCFATNVANADIEAVESSNVDSAIRELLDETLNFIVDPLQDECGNNGDMAVLNCENIAPLVYSTASPISYNTVVTSDDNNEALPSNIEYVLNRSFDSTLGNESIMSLNDTHFTVTDFDALSFKSMTSGSKLSGYLSADNEFSSSIKLPKCSKPAPTSSVREIFERKDQPLQPAENQNTTGSLANQAFSGFTLNEEPVAGDKPDLVNIIDSETGSLLAVAAPRLVTSEELLISGRSSESFESCVLDDDAVVPNWLFQLISHQGSSLDELEPPAELMGPLPVVEPLFDDNGNVMEAPGAGAGAGDGRGIHSDHSQDSSGHGTSVSSSETSSGQQSEVILIDPAAFAAQFELMRNAVDSSLELVVNSAEASDNATSSRQVPATQDPEPQSCSGGEADVSSLDTDVPDSSDN